MTAFDKQADGFSDEAIACMREYDWPGNVRELRNEIQRMLVMVEGDELGADLLSPRVIRGGPSQQGDAIGDLASEASGGLKEQVEALEARILRETLIRHRWKKSRAADELGLSRVGLRNKLERYPILPGGR